MSGLRLWLCINAVGLAGFGLAAQGLHTHDDGHHHHDQHHHTHTHSHGGTTHTHHHSHHADDRHVPQPYDDDVPRQCGGDEHHCCMEHGQPNDVHFTLPQRESRRLSELNIVTTLIGTSPAGTAFLLEAWTPPRGPPTALCGQDALPQLRTIVLLT